MPSPSDVNTVKQPEEPVTPEFASSNDLNLGDRRHLILPPTAPKGKPKARPLIHAKIKIDETTDGEMSGGSGSKIPLLKTKHLEAEHHQGKRGVLNNGSSAQRDRDSKLAMAKSSVEVHRTVEKVRLPKGIEMRRVVQESNGIKAKKYSSTALNSKAVSSSLVGKESSHGSSNGTQRRKMTKVEASFPEVKSFSGHLRPSCSGFSQACKSKSNDVDNNALPDNDRITSSEKRPEPEETCSQITNKLVTVPETQDSAVNFKTIDEFLKMPEISLSEAKPRSPVKKTIYKSKFWEYIDPKISNKNSKSSSKEHKKPYDPDAVKNFMQKQKETRKIQQIKDSKEKEAESAKRQRMLKELDSKCQKIALKGKTRGFGEGISADNHEDMVKKPKLEKQAQSPSMKYLKPLLERKQGSLLRKSDSCTRDVARQSQYLLAEFENIVKRECISFLQKIPIPPSQTNIDSTVEMVDKAVATSASLLGLSLNSSSEQKPGQSQSDDLMDIESLEHDELKLKHPRVPSPETVEKAVTKIQALYRGYKVRRTLKDAKVLLRKPVHKRCSEVLNQSQSSTANQVNPNRRWSFPRMPEKPYDNLSKIQPMSPIPMVGKSSEYFVNCYIPPPPAAGQVPRSPSRPRVLPSFPLTPVRVYDEPYPKQTRKSTEAVDRANGNIHLTAAQDSVPISQPMTTEDKTMPRPPSMENAVKNLAPVKSTNCDFEFIVPSSLPSIVDVLREKLRLFSDENRKCGSNLQVLKEKSSEDWKLSKNLGKESGDLSTATNDVTPKIKKHKRRSRPRSQRSPVGDSTTTVETDGEYIPSATRSSMSISHRQKSSVHEMTNVSKSEEALRSSSLEDPTTTTSSFDNFLAPALHLRYQAEREHLKIIEKALQVRLQGNLPAAGSVESVRSNEQPQETGSKENVMKSSPSETDRVQLAIANCQKESMKAAAEMAKWMSEFQKTTREHERVPQQQAPVDLAATVIAAVEQARIIGIEKRKGKRLQDKDKQRIPEQVPNEHVQTPMSSESITRSSETVSKADKSAETSFMLGKSIKEMHLEKHKKDDADNIEVTRKLRDYQQQFPSESDRDSPLLVKQATPSFDVPDALREYKNRISRHSSPEEVISKFQDPIDYPSIIPSGNSVDFTSLDPRVSTLEYVSQISSEREKTNEEASLDEDINNQANVLILSQHNDMAEIVPEHSGSGTFNVAPFSHHSTIIDDAASSRNSSISVEVSSVKSTVDQVSSEHLNSVKDVSLHSSMKVEDEADESEVGVISAESKIGEKIVSEQSKIIDNVSQQSSIEEEIENTDNIDIAENVSMSSKIEEDISEHSNVENGSHESSIQEMISKQSFVQDVSDHIIVEKKISKKAEMVNKLEDVHTEEVSAEENITEEVSVKENITEEVSIKENITEEVNIKECITEEVSIKENITEEVSVKENITEEVSVKKNITEEEISDHFESDENASDDQIEVVEDKATETELPEENLSVSEKDISYGTGLEGDSDPNYSHSFVEDLIQHSDTKQKSQHDPHTPNTGGRLTSSDASINVSEEQQDVEKEKESPLIMEVEEKVRDEGVFSQHIKKLNTEDPEQVSLQSLEDIASSSDNQFEEDTTTVQSKIIEEKASEILEVPKSPENYKEVSESIADVNKITAESVPETPLKLEVETILKPPPPYTPPASTIVSPDSETKAPSLAILPKSSSGSDENQSSNVKENVLEKEIDEEPPTSSGNSSSTQSSSLAENVPEKLEVDVEISEESPIIDETSERSKEEEEIIVSGHANVKPDTEKSEDQVSPKKVEAEANSQDTQGPVSKSEFEAPIKPPPPYSPSSSLDSTSLSSRSLIVSLPDEKLEKITREQTEMIWEVWKSGDVNLDLFPDMNTIMNVMYEKNLVKITDETSDNNGNGNQQSSAEHSFDVLVCHLIYETMKEVLQVRNNFTSFIERVRPGPLSLQAQKLKIPKTKDALVKTVLNRVIKIIPSGFFSEPHLVERDRPKLRKWCSRPRELVDEILLEELVEEDYQWTEWWPEEVIISHHISTKIIQTLVRNALQKRKYVYSK